MNGVGQPERATQNRVIVLFRDELAYRYLGDWTDRPNNSNIEVAPLTAYLTKSGYSPTQISRALDRLRTEASNPNRGLYDNNKAVYSLLRYGVPTNCGQTRFNLACCLIYSSLTPFMFFALMLLAELYTVGKLRWKSPMCAATKQQDQEIRGRSQIGL